MWYNIKDYPDYKVNRTGQVKSFKYKEERIMKPYIDKYGYLVYRLVNSKGEKKAYKSHRIVANTFIENPNNLPIVNHINGIKTDNRVENIEWCDNSYNTQHAWDNNLIKGYTVGVEIYDIHKQEIVSRMNGYSELQRITRLSYAMLYEMSCEGKILYEGFLIITVGKNDFSTDELFNRVFVERTIHGRFVPCLYDGNIYSSINELTELTGIPLSTVRRYLEKGLYKNKELKRITQYEYVTMQI